GIFPIQVDLSRDEHIVTDKCPAEIQPPFHSQRRMRLNPLREQFREHDLLGEIFRTDNNCFPTAFAASACYQHDQQRENIQRQRAYRASLTTNLSGEREFIQFPGGGRVFVAPASRRLFCEVENRKNCRPLLYRGKGDAGAISSHRCVTATHLLARLRWKYPKPESAAIARHAAGIAPARMT